MIYFFRRAGDTRTCETRLEPKGRGFELVVTDGTESRTERFDDVSALRTREYELRQVWQVHGWRTVDPFDEVEEDE